jgi:16S rRNA (guanine966-N2)-methyltransferase
VGRLRIVAGALKGRRIDVPDRGSVRPTSDRAREALFSVLGDRVVGARVLDAYCGSGALGFEALSRGAAGVVFLDRDRVVLAALRATAERLGVYERCEVREGRVRELLSGHRRGAPYDLVLADPPYSGGELPAFLGWTLAHLADEAIVVVEREGREAAVDPPPGFVRFRSSRYGRTGLDFFRRATS